jgi:hypothetical protein
MNRFEEPSYKGVVKDGAVVLDDSVRLPEGTPVIVTMQGAPTGTPEAVLAAMAQGPSLSQEDVSALLHEIERGRRPIQFSSPLD